MYLLNNMIFVRELLDRLPVIKISVESKIIKIVSLRKVLTVDIDDENKAIIDY